MSSLKIDSVTRLNPAFLGIQFINNDKIVLRTLGLVELKQSHAGMVNFSLLVFLDKRQNYYLTLKVKILENINSLALKPAKLGWLQRKAISVTHSGVA